MIKVENYFLIVLALIWIFIAVVQDLRKREVANWLNFSLIAIALSYRACVSVWLWNYLYFVYGLVGFGIFFLLAHLFYYGRVFAGGDAKLLMSLGAVLPFSSFLIENLEIFAYFLILLMFAGSIYGLIYSIFLSYRNKQAFSKEFLKQLSKNKRIFFVFIFLAALILVLSVKFYLFALFSLIVLIFPFLYAYAKAIEESCMIKKVAVKELTIGDWLYNPVKIGRKTIKPNWEGLSEQELEILKKLKGNKKILIKQGIPFTPSFLFAFLALIWILRNPYWSFW